MSFFATEGFIPVFRPNFMPSVTTAQVNAVPEPSTILLLCSGLFGFAGLRRRFKKN